MRDACFGDRIFTGFNALPLPQFQINILAWLEIRFLEKIGFL